MKSLNIDKAFYIIVSTLIITIITISSLWVGLFIKRELKQENDFLQNVSTKINFVFADSISSVETMAKYVGPVTMEFAIDDIYKTIEDSINLKEAKTLIVNKDYYSLEIDKTVDLSNNLSGQIVAKSGFLQEPLKYKGITYRYYERVDKYPYIILTGYNASMFINIIINQVTPYLLITLLLLASMMVTLFFIKKLIITPIKELSDSALNISNDKYVKNRFPIYEMNQLNKILIYTRRKMLKEKREKIRLQEENLVIEQKTESLIKSEQEQKKFDGLIYQAQAKNVISVFGKVNLIKADSQNQKQITILDEIEKDLENVFTNTSLTEEQDSCGKINIFDSISDAITLNYKYLVPKNMPVENLVSEDIGEIDVVDTIRFRQILVALIANVILFMPGNTIKKNKYYIKIMASYDENILTIVIEENGIGLSESARQSITDNFDLLDVMPIVRGEELSLAGIQKLVKLHHGYFKIKTDNADGKTNHILTIPDKKFIRKEKDSNVIDLTDYFKYNAKSGL